VHGRLCCLHYVGSFGLLLAGLCSEWLAGSDMSICLCCKLQIGITVALLLDTLRAGEGPWHLSGT
jgi:hypothetical protein